jgi:DNA-binding HxlR family transcriptional regulator
MMEITQTCSAESLEEALQVLEGRWKLLIIFRLFGATTLRFSELLRSIDGVSQKMLIQQLRDLEAHGMIARTVYAVIPPKVEYMLTDDGRALKPVLRELTSWSEARGRPVREMGHERAAR